jgi:hypothetical protein
MMELFYTLGALVMIAGYIIAGVIIWQLIEGIYWIYCKIKGIDY